MKKGRAGGQVNVPLMLVLSIVFPLFTALGVYFTAYASIRSDVAENRATITGQQKQLERIENDVSRILDLLLERK
jgi:hypothetical protein